MPGSEQINIKFLGFVLIIQKSHTDSQWHLFGSHTHLLVTMGQSRISYVSAPSFAQPDFYLLTLSNICQPCLCGMARKTLYSSTITDWKTLYFTDKYLNTTIGWKQNHFFRSALKSNLRLFWLKDFSLSSCQDWSKSRVQLTQQPILNVSPTAPKNLPAFMNSKSTTTPYVHEKKTLEILSFVWNTLNVILHETAKGPSPLCLLRPSRLFFEILRARSEQEGQGTKMHLVIACISSPSLNITKVQS